MIVIKQNNRKTILFYQKSPSELIPLSSKFSPDVEGKRILNHQMDQKASLIFLIGLGNFYLGLEVLKKYQQQPIIIFEFLDEIVSEFKSWMKDYFKKFLMRGKNVFFVGRKNWSRQVKELIYSLNSQDSIIFQNQKQVLLFPQDYEEIPSKINHFKKQKKVNRSTIAKFEKIWFKNLIKNTAKIIRSYPIKKLKNWGKGELAAVIGAGPSLKLDLALLKKQQSEMIILAVDTVFKTLINNEIYPDLVISVDPQKINAKYLENLPNEVVEKTILIHEPSINNSPLRTFAKNVVFDAIFPFYQLIIKNIGSKGEIEVGGSVITVALEVVQLMNFKKAIFLGLDLCYQENEYHLPGTLYEEIWFSKINRFKTHEMMLAKITNPLDERKTFNRLNSPVFTDTKFELFKNWIERKLEDSTNLFNGSKLGVEVRNLPFLPFEQFLQENPSKSKKKFLKAMHDELDHHFTEGPAGISDKIKKLKSNIKELILEFQENLGQINSLLQETDFREHKNLSKITTFQLSDKVKPFVEILLQKSIHQLDKKEHISNQMIETFYREISDALNVNLKYFTKIKL